MVTAAMLLKLDFMGLFFTVLRKRLGEAFCLILFSMTPAAPFLFMGTAAYLGFSTAVTVSSLTMGSGLSGIFRYLALVFPPGCAVHGCILCDGLVDGGGEKEDDRACSPGAGPGSGPGSGGGKLCESVDNCLITR